MDQGKGKTRVRPGWRRSSFIVRVCGSVCLGVVTSVVLGCTGSVVPGISLNQPQRISAVNAGAGKIILDGMDASFSEARAEPLSELYGINAEGLSCEETQNVAYQTLERMGYTIDSVSRWTRGSPALLTAEKKGRDGPAQVQVRVECQDGGNHVDAASLSPLDVASDKPHPLVTDYHESEGARLTKKRPPPTTYFRRAFYSLFRGLAENQQRYGPVGQVYIDVRPLPQKEAEFLFGVQTPEVLTVVVEVANRTGSIYVLDTRNIILVSSAGGGVNSLPEEATPSLPMPLQAQAVASHSAALGYMYFPRDDYLGARGYVVESVSQEREGFHIIF